eukprot:g8412.t1
MSNGVLPAVVVGVLFTVDFVLALSTYSLRDFSRSRLSDICKLGGREDRFSDILKRYERVLLTMEMGIATVTVLLVAVIGFCYWPPYDTVTESDNWIPLTWQIPGVIVAVICVIVLLPWTIANVAGESFLYRFWPLLSASQIAVRPLVSVCERFDRLVHRIAGRELPEDGDAATITEEIRTVVEEGQREGVLESEARTMIHRVMELQEDDTAAIMTPRTEMVCIRVDASLEEARECLLTAGHSRIPVIGESTDDIIGILYAKDLLHHLHTNGAPGVELRDIVREPYYVPETTGIDTLLENMKRKRVHLAIVVDEYGGVAGLVSMEDILEEIVGEIVDEYDAAEETGIQTISPDVVDVESRVHIDDLNEQFDFGLPEGGDYDTIGGFVFHQLGRVPKSGEHFTWEKLRVTVQAADTRKIHKVRIEAEDSREKPDARAGEHRTLPRMPRFLISLVLLATVCSAEAAEKEPSAPLSPQETAKRMQLPPGFKATVFAAEPDIVQPMAMTFDDRGRLWVVECLSYPEWISPEGQIVNRRKRFTPKDKSRVAGRDRITILEDSNGDGKHDKRTVFYNKGKNFTGIEYGFGGVFVTAPPYLLFIPDKNHDDKPDGEPVVLLDGWDLTAGHNAVNGLTWGPDGWLYGCNGILSNSSVGQPGTPDKDRVKMNCGVWRYHPTRKIVEAVAHGSTNPWGLDFNADGDMFITNCVIKHLFHVIPGGHYERMFGQDVTPYVYGLMQSCADHIHWGGGKWTTSRGGHGIHDKPGGGHAHAGCMIYLGDNWPAKYRGKLFTCNIHGNRVNMDILKRKGSGYVASHGPDFLKVPDPWFRGLEMKYGPDGGVYITDWSDSGECHDYEDIHRENGRIYKITFGEVKPWRGDLAKLDGQGLHELRNHRNHWFRRHSIRLRREHTPAIRFSSGLESKNPAILHAHIVRQSYEHDKQSARSIADLANDARATKSPIVRLAHASGLQRLPLKDRWPIAEALVAHGEDATDSNIPLMIWYGIEPAVAKDKVRAIQLLKKTKIPLIRQYIARRLAEAAK